MSCENESNIVEIVVFGATILKYETFTKGCGLNVGSCTVKALLLLIKISMKQQLLAFNLIKVKLRLFLVIFSEIQTLINKRFIFHWNRLVETM